MKIRVGKKTIRLPKKVVIDIAKKHNPQDFLYIADFGICIMLVYEEAFVELNKILHGYLIYPYENRYSGFVTMDIDYRTFNLKEKKEAVEHYLGTVPESREETIRLFDGLIWLKKQLEEPIDIPDDLLF